jgi:dihydroneopterin aldolase
MVAEIGSMIHQQDGHTILVQQVLVSDIRIAAEIGVLSHERGRRQPLIVNVELTIVPVSRDSLAETIDYNYIVALAEELAGQPIALIETFAQRMAQGCLKHAQVLRANVHVAKPAALTNGLAAARVSAGRDQSR